MIVDGNSMGAAAAVFAARELAIASGATSRAHTRTSRSPSGTGPSRSAPAAQPGRLRGLDRRLPTLPAHLDEISPLKAIAGIQGVPVLILAGNAAARPPRARPGPARPGRVPRPPRLVPGAEHGDLHDTAPDLYTQTILEFCRGITSSDRISSSRLTPKQSQ